MKENRTKAVRVCLAIKGLLLIGGIALALCSSAKAANTFTLLNDGISPTNTVIQEGSSVTVTGVFTDASFSNNAAVYSGYAVFGDSITNALSVSVSPPSTVSVSVVHSYLGAVTSGITISVTNMTVTTDGTTTALASMTVTDAPISVATTNIPSVVEGNLATNVTLFTFFDANSLASTSQYSNNTAVTATFSDSGNVYSQAFTVASAGATNGGQTFAVNANLEFYEFGISTVAVHVVDNSGGSSLSTTVLVVIADAPLSQVSTGTLVVTEGTIGPTNETLLTFTDANLLNGSVGDFIATVQWGDTTRSVSSGTVSLASATNVNYDGGVIAGSNSIQVVTNIVGTATNYLFKVVGEHAYPTNGTYFITVQVNDMGGVGQIAFSGIPDTVVDAGLTVLSNNLALVSLPGFESLAQKFDDVSGAWLIVFSDTNEFSQYPPISAVPNSYYSAMINWGDGSNTVGTVSNLTGTTHFAVWGNHTYDVTCTNYTMVVKAVDLTGGAFCVATTTVVIAAAPIIGYGYDFAAAAANSTFNGTLASFTDPDLALNVSSFTATIDWGDDTPFTSGQIVAFGSGSYLVQGTHMYLNRTLSNETATVTVYDNVDTCAIPVKLPPTTITFTGTSPGISFVTNASLEAYIAVGTDVSFTTNLATFTDSSLPPGDAFDLSAAINWGDGTASAGLITTNAADQYVVGGTHTYLDDGAYRVSVEVVDIDGRHNTLSNITIVAESQYTDWTSSVEVLFGPVKIKQYKSAAALHHTEDFYYSEVVTLKNTSGATLNGPFGLVVGTTHSNYQADWLNITGQLADGRIYVPLSKDTLKKKGTIKVTLQWSLDEQHGTGPKVLPIRLIAGPGL